MCKKCNNHEKSYCGCLIYRPPAEQKSLLYRELMWNDDIAGYIAFHIKYLENNAHHSYEYIRYFTSEEQLKNCDEYTKSKAVNNIL